MVRFGRANKFKNTEWEGFPSKLEYAVYQWLKKREDNKEITNIKRQQTVTLSRAKINYKVDFSYENLNGETIWVEAKGFPTDVWNLKKKLWAYYGPGPLEIWAGSYKSPSLKETIYPTTGDE